MNKKKFQNSSSKTTSSNTLMSFRLLEIILRHRSNGHSSLHHVICIAFSGRCDCCHLSTVSPLWDTIKYIFGLLTSLSTSRGWRLNWNDPFSCCLLLMSVQEFERGTRKKKERRREGLCVCVCLCGDFGLLCFLLSLFTFVILLLLYDTD